MTEENNETSPKQVDGINVPQGPVRKDTTPNEEPLTKEKKTEKKKRTIKFNKKKLAITGLVILGLLLVGTGYKVYQLRKQAAAEKAKTEETKVTEEEPKSEPVPADKIVYVKVNEGLRLRQDPSYSSKTIMTMPYGAKLTILNEQSEWYNVSYEDHVGWCIKYYTTTQKPKEMSIRDVDFSKIITTKDGLSLLQPVQYGDYNKDGQEEALVTVKNGKISDVTLKRLNKDGKTEVDYSLFDGKVHNGKTYPNLKEFRVTMAKKMVEKQSTQVETIAGATTSTKNWMVAAQRALDQAKK
jgi:major membrane immunogen (membrane-anchored lipoprotein)